MKKINFNEPYITGNELGYIEDVFNQKRFYGCGKYTDLCTQLIRSQTNSRKVLLTDSCTSALEIIALLLKSDSRSQEVIVPSYTFSSTAAAFARAGFKIVFADVDPKTMMLDTSLLGSYLSENTCAVVGVHYGGYPCDVQGISSFCREHGLYFVEDAAQAYGAFLDDKSLGTYGDFATFSFHETKNIHSGLSGALLLNISGFDDRATHIWERGTNRQQVLKGIVDKYSWVEVGGSFYPTELQAAFLYAQLQSLSDNMAQRKDIYDAYQCGLDFLKREGVIWFPDNPPGYASNYHAFWICFESEEQCDAVRIGLNKAGIAAYIGYVPLHSSEVGLGMGYSVNSIPLTETYAKRILRLPFHNNLGLEDVLYVVSKIKESVS